jgi:hypothetical protein
MVMAIDSYLRQPEQRLRELGIQLPQAPKPFGALLFLSGMMPTVGHEPKMVGRVGKEFDADAARGAARIAALDALAADSRRPYEAGWCA